MTGFDRPPADAIADAVQRALREDLGQAGDVTSDAVVGETARGRARIVAREPFVVAGLPVACAVFRAVDASVEARELRRDGERVGAGEALLAAEGLARSLLAAERTALNFLQRLCGIATASRAAVEEVVGTGATILDTRKTAPGLRLLDKYAVSVGGARNHRMGLYDAVLIKDTHVAIAGTIAEAVRRSLASGHSRESITVEVDSPAALREALDAGAGRALLDNMSVEAIHECVRIGGGRVVLEASGGLRPGSLRRVAETGVGFLSVGWLTHSVRAADLAMEMEALSRT